VTCFLHDENTTVEYHCILCDQRFNQDDRVTPCPNSATNAHTVMIETVHKRTSDPNQQPASIQSQKEKL